MTLTSENKKRNGVRVSVRRILTNTQAILTDFRREPSNDLLTKLQGKRSLLILKLEDLKKYDASILGLISEESDDSIYEKEICESDDFNGQVIELIEESTVTQMSSPSSVETVHGSRRSSIETGNHPSIHLNLPKLTLPTFNGDILQWQTFWDCFQADVHSNTSLSSE